MTKIKNLQKKAVVVHSGGMDSSICLALAIEKLGAENVLSMTFTYGQRHTEEIAQAKQINEDWGVDHVVVNLDCLQQITESSLLDKKLAIKHGKSEKSPNTMVVGRNGLMARVASIHADFLGANNIYMGVIELEEANSGYRDCSRKYMDIVQAALRVDFANPDFEIQTPLVFMTKKQTMDAAYQMGKLEYLLENTISCYEGISGYGCGKCPACELRNEGIQEYLNHNPDIQFSYKNKFTLPR
ncbi:MAG: 7-cyano-7-deazaguanine synthase QueC [Bacteriovoracaceae bacterium]